MVNLCSLQYHHAHAEIPANGRRGFLRRVLTATGLAAAAPQSALPQSRATPRRRLCSPPTPGRRPTNRSSNRASTAPAAIAIPGPSPPAACRRFSAPTGPASSRHIWFTIAAQSDDHLKELVLRAYWDGNAKPSVEAPIGDFFGLNLGVLSDLPVGVSGLLAGQVAQLLFRHAVPQVGAVHGHQ